MPARFPRLAAAALCGLVLAVPGLVRAQFTGADTLYARGAMGFTYRQTPIPIYSGVFDVAGESLAPDGSWHPGQTEAVGGGMGMATPDSVLTAIYGIQDNGDGTYDGAIAALRTFGALRPGVFPINVQAGSALFIFVDDAVALDLPDTLDADAVIQWFQDLPADHKFVSISGSIAVSAVSADTLAGTFSGTASDIDSPLFLINVSAGHFALAGDEALAVEGLPLAPATLTAAPNPFNPRTTLRFALPEPQAVTVAVYDPLGRRVRVLHDGPLAGGAQQLTWDGTDAAGHRVGAGVYLARAEGRTWSQSTKLVLLP